jgi:hypothetical protein
VQEDSLAGLLVQIKAISVRTSFSNALCTFIKSDLLKETLLVCNGHISKGSMPFIKCYAKKIKFVFASEHNM